MLKRESGILLHITSLPGKYGIGDLGKGAYEFVDFLEKTQQKLWQVLPLGVTGYGDSPYQAFSAFAGNPYFIDLDEFLERKMLSDSDLKILKELNREEKINYGTLYNERYKVLRKAYENFKKIDEYLEIEKIKKRYSSWLPEYSLFMALKNHFNGVSWQEWPRAYRVRDKKVLSQAKVELKDEIEFYIFLEYFFRKQWLKLKEYANTKGIKIIGDIPIFVSTDSVDTWTKPEMFQFDKNLRPKKVAGCPPDAFSATGQLWGNVLYNWKVIKKDGYKWWIDRIKDCFKLYDIVRIDHFRGFDSYWAIPARDKTAKNGKWEIGPGIELFKTIKKKLGNVAIIAEDLGFLTSRVKKLLKDSGYPGMKILQFGFDGRIDNEYLPEFAPKNSITYTGTHDNQTTRGWCENLTEKDIKFSKEYLQKYLNEKIEELNPRYFIEAAFKSKSNWVIIPMQDLLNLDDGARMNTPSTLGNNWCWRLKNLNISDENIEYLKEITQKYQR